MLFAWEANQLLSMFSTSMKMQNGALKHLKMLLLRFLLVLHYKFIFCASLQADGTAQEWYARPEPEWLEGERLLAVGAAAVAELRLAVQNELGFSCSAGDSLSQALNESAYHSVTNDRPYFAFDRPRAKISTGIQLVSLGCPFN